MKTHDLKIHELMRKLVIENLLFEEGETVDVESHNMKVYDELKKNVAAIGGIPRSLRDFYSNKIQDVLKASEGGIAYTQIVSWLEDNTDFKILAEKGDKSGIINKIKANIERYEDKVFDVMKKYKDLKGRETAKKNIKFDEPLARLLRIIDERINRQAAGPKVMMSELDVAVRMSLVPEILVAVSKLKSE